MQIQVNGDSAYVNTGGVELDSGKPSIVFIHGAAMDHTAWVLFVRYFARAGYNALSIDLPGNGRSGGEPLPRVENMADWIAALLDALGIEQATLVGHSMGSLIALEAAARHPTRASRIVLLGTAFPMPVSEYLLDAAQAGKHSAVDMMTLFSHSFAAQLGGNLAPGINIQNSGIRLLEKALGPVMYSGLVACNEYQNGLQAAAQLQCPAVLLVGSQDLMTPPKAAKVLAAEMPEARIIDLPGCGHMMMSEQPEAVHQALVAALR